MKNRNVFSLVTALSCVLGSTAFANVSPFSSSQVASTWPGLVIGRIWHDRNGDGSYHGEAPIARAKVYIDENDNGIHDPGEPSTHTGSSGYYAFYDLPVGDYVIRQKLEFGWQNTTNSGGPSLLNFSNAQEKDDAVIQIIGGDETAPNEYSFMAALGTESGGVFSQFCGGVLISNRWVATAAHCSERINPELVAVMVGSENADDGSGHILKIKDIYLHPEYRVYPTNADEPYSVAAGYDIALWELEKPIALKENGLQSISLLSPENDHLAEDGVLATTVGWGVTDLDSSLLQDVHLPIYDSQACEDVYSGSINFDTQICGGVPSGGIDACQGDSGGPLLVRDFYQDQWKVAGITSYGNGCALEGFPGVWARTSVLSDWVNEVAVEPSVAQRITVHAGQLTFADFANSETTYEPRTSIAPRWQLVDMQVSAVLGEDLGFDWQVIDESPWPRVFDCELDVDSAGPEPSVYSDCYEGENWLPYSPVADGIYIATLTASSGETNFSREKTYVLGTPPEKVVYGELSVDDQTDPDFPTGTYYIDHYNIEDLSSERVVSIQVEPTNADFDIYVGLYDRDIRERDGSGGLIQYFGSNEYAGVAEYQFFPDPNINYVIGVSAYYQRDVGEYSLKILNDGTPVATEIGVSSAPAIRRLRKMPKLRSVIPVPEVQ